MTRAEAGEIVGAIALAFPVPAWDDPQLALWAKMLIDLPAAETEAAVTALIQSSEERPTIATVRRAVAVRLAAASNVELLDADEAWGFVSECFGTVGRYATFPETYPAVKAAVEMLGWRAMCDSDRVDVVRGQFLRTYASLLERTKESAAASPGAAALPDFTRRKPQLGKPRVLELVDATAKRMGVSRGE